MGIICKGGDILAYANANARKVCGRKKIKKKKEELEEEEANGASGFRFGVSETCPPPHPPPTPPPTLDADD